ncbi:SRPBCC domain-containing protein [Bacillus sp. OK048]|uniref:SRPBCC family protein n=1 Tax=Bacillus sp. OK048 TaxID=1882761 RepID=UPI000882F52C|nr:SRPBCC domain-containing protein [Bacillus sp. OK048]SDM60757.1 Uncharacterized conserved protein YndB, AHSA1/START domain [Bacillus sp. OK048]
MENILQDIKQTVVINAPIQKVWDQVSTSEGIAAWLMPNDFKPEVGAEFHIQSPFGPSPCKVTEFNPPNGLSFIWDTDGWFLSFSLKEVGDGQTEFTLIHGGWPQSDAIIGKANQKASAIRENMSQGWAGIVQKLRTLLEN